MYLKRSGRRLTAVPYSPKTTFTAWWEVFSSWIQNHQQTNRFILEHAYWSSTGIRKSTRNNTKKFPRTIQRQQVVWNSEWHHNRTTLLRGIMDWRKVHDLPLLLENLDLQTRQNLWFMHDGAPAHQSRQVTEHLNNTFPNRWMGFNSLAVQWPARPQVKE